ncbi:MAG: outer rane efflux protein [Gemmatimonadetes bacterium]|nr:outer rane efflux protein [Gemmatimonadota bacterium]
MHTNRHLFFRAAALAALLYMTPWNLLAQESSAGASRGMMPTVRIDSTLDLPTVIARAIAVSPAVAGGQAGVRTARSEGRVANGAYLPSLTATSNALRSDVATTPTLAGNGATSYSAGLATSIDLFTGGRRGADKLRSRADLEAAQAVDVSQRYQVTLAAERAYYEALRGGDLMTVADARVLRAAQGLKYARDRVRAGTATKSDDLRASLELTTARQQALASRDTLQAAAYALGRLVGADGPIGAKPPATLDPRPLSMSDTEIVQLAVSAAPTVQAAEASARATEAANRSARSLYAPDIRLLGGYNFANQTSLIGATRPGWQLGLGTSFPIFNGFQREDAVTRAEALAEVSRVTALDATRQVRADASRLLSALRFAQENISLASDAVTAAREDLRVQTDRYRAGIATSLDRLTSEVAVTQAELGLVAAHYNYQITRATLEALVGRSL